YPLSLHDALPICQHVREHGLRQRLARAAGQGGCQALLRGFEALDWNDRERPHGDPPLVRSPTLTGARVEVSLEGRRRTRAWPPRAAAEPLACPSACR